MKEDMDLQEQYEAMTVEQLEELFSNAILTPEAELLCKMVINDKAGEERYCVQEAKELADANIFVGGPLGGFERVFTGKHRISIGWMALFFGPYWLAYRKMWVDAALFAFFYPTPFVVVLAAIYTLFGKYRYYTKYLKAKASAPISQPERAKFLAERGGVTAWGWVAAILFVLLSAIFFFFIRHFFAQ